MKVNFIICGTQKGGTSALDAYLREHGEIFMARTKEVHFFDEEKFFRGKKPDYAKYHSCFTTKKSRSWFTSTELHEVIGEATPSYMYWHDAPRRIWEYNPNMKLIVLLRNPIDRAYSHWNMARRRKPDGLSFWDSLQNERELSRTALPYQHKRYSYVDRGFYLEQLRRLWFYFPKDQVLILKSEYLKDQRIEALRDVCEFLEVDSLEPAENKNVLSGVYESEMSRQEREYLQFVFEYEIRGLERVLGWDCSDWFSK